MTRGLMLMTMMILRMMTMTRELTAKVMMMMAITKGPITMIMRVTFPTMDYPVSTGGTVRMENVYRKLWITDVLYDIENNLCPPRLATMVRREAQ